MTSYARPEKLFSANRALIACQKLNLPTNQQTPPDYLNTAWLGLLAGGVAITGASPERVARFFFAVAAYERGTGAAITVIRLAKRG